jgi:putative ABC transport system permease protein
MAGGTLNFFDTNSFDIGLGRAFSESEIQGGSAVMVIGPDIADVLFPNIDPLGEEIRLKGRSFRVIGVMTRKGSLVGPGYDTRR